MIEYDIWFSMLDLSYRTKLQLIKRYNTAEALWNEFNSNNIEDKDISTILKNSWDILKINSIKETVVKNNIKIVSFNDAFYPQKLKIYNDAPSVLFYKGDISKLNLNYNISIVGSRKCTSYGINSAKLIAAELSKNNINIISGLARGVDSYTHASCIENNGYTCAVLGCGLDIIYPKENKKLYDNIQKQGVILSEFIPGTQPFAYNFPIRNRIISELSDLVIVIEAGIKSGSLITANLALDLGIDVAVVPGSIFSEQSKGCNKLIKDGAYPLTEINDIFELINIDYNYNIGKSGNLSDIEAKVHDALSDNPIHIDDIIKLTNIDIKQLYEVLFELQLKNEIMCLAGNYYVKFNKNI